MVSMSKVSKTNRVDIFLNLLKEEKIKLIDNTGENMVQYSLNKASVQLDNKNNPYILLSKPKKK